MANGRKRGRRSRSGAPKSVNFYVDTSGVDGFADYLDSLGQFVEDAIRPVAYAGAEVFYRQVQMNVAGIGKVSGNLASSIYHAYMKEQSVPGKSAFYRISWNVNKAPHGRFLEWGWVQTYASYVGSDGKWYTNKKVPRPGGPVHWMPRSFIRRALSAKPEAEEAMKKKFLEYFNSESYGGG